MLQSTTCRKCKSNCHRKKRSKWFKRYLPFVFIYFCHKCLSTSYRISFRFQQDPIREPLQEITDINSYNLIANKPKDEADNAQLQKFPHNLN